MRTLLYSSVLSLSFLLSPSSLAQDGRGTLVITTTNKKEKVAYRDAKIEAASGEIFSCPQQITAKTSCVLSGVPSGRVKLTASGKGSVSRWIDLPAGDNTLLLSHSYRGVFIASGIALLVTSALSFALLEQQDQDEALVFNAAIAGIGGGYILSGLLFPAELVQLNGKLVRGRASKAK